MVTEQMVLIAEKTKLLWFSSNHFAHDTERLICSRASIRLHFLLFVRKITKYLRIKGDEIWLVLQQDKGGPKGTLREAQSSTFKSAKGFRLSHIVQRKDRRTKVHPF
jgi:hypothetical protein